ncbi:MAG: hypothetical protein AAF692_13605, partial [Pseudomonadota bacterium]
MVLLKASSLSATLGSLLLSMCAAAGPQSETAKAEPVRPPQGVTLKNTNSFAIRSQRVGDDYFIKIAVPRGYDQSKKRYPVLYITDAETNFGAMQYLVQRLAKDRLM